MNYPRDLNSKTRRTFVGDVSAICEERGVVANACAHKRFIAFKPNLLNISKQSVLTRCFVRNFDKLSLVGFGISGN